jgi:phage-related baseplate assembly protein
MTDLSTLPAPAIVEPLDYETLLASRKAALVAQFPVDAQAAIQNTLQLESEPLVKLLEENTYRELILRNRINEAAKACMVAYASGADLDQLGANFNVTRLVVSPADTAAVPPVDAVLETDAEFRERILLSLSALSVAGPISAYRYHALSASGQVLDVGVTSPQPLHVLVSVLGRTGDGTASAELIAKVDAALNDETIRPLCDIVTVQSADIVPYTVKATLVLNAQTDKAVTVAAAAAALATYTASVHRVGQPVACSGLYAALHQTGVARVHLLEPVADLLPGPTGAGFCTGVALTTEVLDG